MTISTGRTIRAALSAALVGLAAGGAAAAPLPLPNVPYRYTVIDQDLVAALQEFGSNMSIRMNISPEVKGRLQGPLPDLTARDFFDRLLALNNLEAYHDGSVLHVTSAKEVQSRLLVLGAVPYSRFEKVLDAFQITDARYKIRRAPEADVALASGPPRFIALVEQTLTGLAAEEQARPRPGAAPQGERTVSVFRGSQVQVLRGARVVYQHPEPPRAEPIIVGPPSEPAKRAEPPAAR